MVSEVADITYHESMMIIVKAMLATVQEEFHITDEQIECFYNKFMSKLPESMQRLLQANWEIYLLKYTVFKEPLGFSVWEVWDNNYIIFQTYNPKTSYNKQKYIW